MIAILLDEQIPHAIASQLTERGFDAVAVTRRPDLIGLPDDEILAAAAAERRALVTRNIRDFAPLHDQSTAAGRTHFGLVLLHSKRCPDTPASIGPLVTALATWAEADLDTRMLLHFLAAR